MYTLEGDDDDDDDDCHDSFHDNNSDDDDNNDDNEEQKDWMLPKGATPVERVVAMVDVPPEQVPEDILVFARCHRSFMEHVRIVIGSTPDENGTTTNNNDSLNNTDNDDDDDLKQTDDDSISFIDANMPPPRRSSRSLSVDVATTPNKSFASLGSASVPPSPSAMESAASILAADAALESELDMPALMPDHLDDSDPFQDVFGEVDSIDNDDDGRPQRTYLILIQLKSDKAARDFCRDLHNQPYTSLDETEVATVYPVVAVQGQGGVSLMSPFFASTHSTDSMPSLRALGSTTNESATTTTEEAHNCAVCLERLETSSLLTTVCNHSFHLDCLLKCKDSPCPVCRYDHSGLNEALSRCHVCGTTQNNFVCLICGVVSCGSCSRPNHAAAAAAAHPSDSNTAAMATTTTTTSSSFGHARQHYDETLHAYALDLETQHVWDFAGQGYVHRLLQNDTDGKLVEVHDPNNSTSHERSQRPGLSEEQEGEVVHRKLEGFASQYYTLLKSQLEQQRIYYEGRLEEMRRQYKYQNRPKKRSASSELIAALKQERNQLSQRLHTLRERYQKTSEDVAFLKNMNESLEANKVPMKRQVAEAQRQRTEARDMVRSCLPPLEEKVTMLMLQLEDAMNGSDGVVTKQEQRKKPPARSRR